MQIRTSIFQLRGPLGPQSGAVRAVLLSVAGDMTGMLGFAPAVSFAGPVDGAITEGCSTTSSRCCVRP